MCKKWGNNLTWINKSENNAPHEATFLKFDSSKIKRIFGWNPKWGINEAIDKTVEWTKAYSEDKDIIKCCDNQINEFFNY